ncbi:MAG TPA: MoaD/ThiS family protein [Kiritimatiellia bacterium]|nr:MoaD/ThiS family protein [Kiritimatiellia bacterium]
MIRLLLPGHLQILAGTKPEVTLDLPENASIRDVIDRLEQQYPALRGTIRDPGTGKRRPMLRFFACERDITHQPEDKPLPVEITRGESLLILVGAIAGG